MVTPNWGGFRLKLNDVEEFQKCDYRFIMDHGSNKETY